MKQGARATWAAGDYPAIARARSCGRSASGSSRRIGVAPGEDVLDVACGTGNAALRAAQAGGRVVGVDLTPELLEDGRRLAAEAGVEIEFLEGDAEALPVADASFDVVVSVMGCMFAPRHRVAAAELARVLRPGGRLCVTGWAPDGEIGTLFKTLGSYLPRTAADRRAAAAVGRRGTTSASCSPARASRSSSSASVRRSPLRLRRRGVRVHASKFGPLIMARPHARAAGALGGAARRPAPHARDTRRPGRVPRHPGRVTLGGDA